MIIVDINDLLGKVMKDVDPDAYKMTKEEQREVDIRFDIEMQAIIENQLVKVYPNGGKEYKEVVIKPARGVFVIEYEDGTQVPFDVKDIDIPDYIEKSGETYHDTLCIRYWEKLTQEERFQIDREREQQRKKAERQAEFLEDGPDRLDVVEEGVDTSYDGIAELGIAVSDIDVTLDDIMDAIAELGQIVEER